MASLMAEQTDEAEVNQSTKQSQSVSSLFSIDLSVITFLISVNCWLNCLCSSCGNHH